MATFQSTEFDRARGKFHCNPDLIISRHEHQDDGTLEQAWASLRACGMGQGCKRKLEWPTTCCVELRCEVKDELSSRDLAVGKGDLHIVDRKLQLRKLELLK